MALRKIQTLELIRPLAELAKYGFGSVAFNADVPGWSADVDETIGVLALRVKHEGKLVWARRLPLSSVFHYSVTAETVKRTDD